MGGKEKMYIEEAFDTNWIAPLGPNLDLFENSLSKLSSNYHVAALSSGTAAIHLALILLGIKKDDDIICSTFTFAASVFPISYLGANPIFVDSERKTWNMCPNLLEDAIKVGIEKNKKPKAIILVHIYGMPASMDDIMCISNKYNIPVIEDAAEALGSKYKSNPLGTFGEFGIYSFNGNKIITTSGGGALLSKDKYNINKAKKLATQAREDVSYYEHKEIGYNYRLSNVCAGIGLGQLDVLQSRIERKREINSYYKNELAGNNNLFFIEESSDSFSNFWMTTCLLDNKLTIDNENLRLDLALYNIEARLLWKPMHLQPIFLNCKKYINGVSEDLFSRGICLPSGTNMGQHELDRVINRIKKLYAS